MPKVYDHLFSAISEISVECRRILERIGDQNVAKETGILLFDLQAEI